MSSRRVIASTSSCSQIHLRLPSTLRHFDVGVHTHFSIDTKNCGTCGPSTWRQPLRRPHPLIGAEHQTSELAQDGLLSWFESRQVGLSGR